MKTFTTLQNLANSLSQNTTTANTALMGQLINDQHRYLLQKYFDNESSYSITTIGANTITLSAIPAVNSTSATLTSVWAYPSVNAPVSFSDGEMRTISFTQNSTAISWQGGIQGTLFYTTNVIALGATLATLMTPWAYTSGTYLVAFSDGETKTATFVNGATTMTWAGGLAGNVLASFNASVIATTIGVGGVQEYRLPADYSKLKTETLTIGNLKWTPTEILTREEWDKLNVFPYYANIPSNFFIYNRKFNIWPIPSTTGNIITFNYKRRVPDLSIADVPGTASVANGSVSVTGASGLVPTNNSVSESRWIQFSPSSTSATNGDNLWYQIQSVDSATSLTLMQPYQGTSLTSGAFTMGQMPLLMEDFHDMLVYGALSIYFSSIVSDTDKFKKFDALFKERLEMLADYAGSKTTHVNLGRQANYKNPNLFVQSIG